jgi:hypothetical protein
MDAESKRIAVEREASAFLPTLDFPKTAEHLLRNRLENDSFDELEIDSDL